MNIRRFGPGHRRADRAAGSNGVLSSAIFSNDIAQITEFTVTPGGAYGPLRSAGDIVLVVIEGRAAGEAVGRKGAPVDAAIIGIIDQVDVHE